MLFSISDIQQIAIKLIVEAGFYFVPCLVLLGMFHIKSLREDASRIVFLFLSLVLLALYLILGNSSSRYLLIPTLIAGCFSGAGLEFISDKIRKIFSKKDSANVIIATAISFIIVFAGIIRCVVRNRDECMDVFAKVIMAESNKTNYVFGINCHSSQKLGGILNQNQESVYYNCISWDEAISEFVSVQSEDNPFYFCVEMPQRYNIRDYINWFQSYYYIFPFDVICESFKGRKRFVLLKFNHKTLDGNESYISADFLDNLPDPLVTQKWKNTNFSFANIGTYFPSNSLTDEHFFELTNGTKIKDNLYVRMELQPPDKPVTFFLRNAVFWPEARCDRFMIESSSANLLEEKPSDTNTDITLPLSESKETSHSLAFPAAPVLLDIIPDVPVVISETNSPCLHLSGAIPGWFSGNKRFLINNSTDEKIEFDLSSGNNVDITVEDRFLKKKVDKKLNISFFSADKTRETDNNLSFLIIGDKDSSALLDLQSGLSSFLPQGTTIDHITGFHKQDILSLSQEQYDIIILNTFSPYINNPWIFPFETDIFFDQDYSTFFKQLKDKFSEAYFYVVLPPAPPPEQTMFPTCFSPKLAKLSHYRICSAAIRWYHNYHPDRTFLVPLYCYADPNDDYTLQWTIENIKVRLGYSFTKSAKAKFGAVLVDYIRFFFQHESQ
jgi:hypothetical protein